MRNIFKFLRFLMAVIMLLDSTVIFAAKSKKKKKGNRKRTAISYKISRGKTKSKSVKDGELSFDNVGAVFKKKGKKKLPKKNVTKPVTPVPPTPPTTPITPPVVTPPAPPKDEPPVNDTDDKTPDMKDALPYVPPYKSLLPELPPKQEPKPNTELAETVKQLKNRFASAKNTCGAYTQTMTGINKQLGLGVVMTSGIGLGLSAIATATGAVSYGMSKKQDKNLKTHAGNQDAIKNMNLTTYDVEGGMGDNDDLSKLKFTKHTLSDEDIKKFENAKKTADEAKKNWEDADGEAKAAEDDLNKPLSEDDEKMPEIGIPKNLQTALDNAKNMSTEPEPEKPAVPKKPTQEEIDEENRVAGLEQKAKDDLQKAKDMPEEPEDPIKQITKKEPTAEEKKKITDAETAAEKAWEAINKADADLKKLKEPQKPEESPELKKAREEEGKAASALSTFDNEILSKKAERDKIIAAGKKAKEDLPKLLKEKQEAQFDTKKHTAQHQEKCKELKNLFMTQDVCDGKRESRETIQKKVTEVKNAISQKYENTDKGTYHIYINMLNGIIDGDIQEGKYNPDNVSIVKLNNLIYLLQKMDIGMLCPPKNEKGFDYSKYILFKKKDGYSAIQSYKDSYSTLRSAGFEIHTGNQYNSLMDYLNTPGNCCEAGKFPDCQYPKPESEEKRKEREAKIKQAEDAKTAYEGLLQQLEKEKKRRGELNKAAGDAKKERERLEKEEKGKYKSAMDKYNKKKADLEAKCNDEERRKAGVLTQKAEEAKKALDKKYNDAKTAEELKTQREREAKIAKLKSEKEAALKAANKLIAEAAEERKKLNKKKEQDAIAAKKKEEEDRKKQIEELKKKKKAAIIAAEEAIKKYKKEQEEKWKKDKEARKAALLAEKKKNAEDLRKEADRLKGIFEEAENTAKGLEEAAKKQKEQLATQAGEEAEVNAKQKALTDSTAKIKKNHKAARGLDIATSTLSAVSAVSSGVSMGFSIATVEAVKKAITQLKNCKADIREIKILNGKFIALTTDDN